MRWYLNDASLQAQFVDISRFERTLRELMGARARIPAIKQNLHTTRSFREASAAPNMTVQEFLYACRDRDLRTAVLIWLDRTGPFVDDDRTDEADDYFEYDHCDVTESGLGEAARRIKSGEDCAAYSFEGGEKNFATDLLQVDHGLPEDRYGRYAVPNYFRPQRLIEHGLASGPPITSWQALVEGARVRFPNLEILDLHEDAMLSREPFESAIRDRAFALMGMLDEYMEGRDEGGAEGPRSRAVIDAHFKGERAYFTGESTTNEQKFKREMTFKGMDDRDLFAPWHGKIGRRFFRLHFEWPLAPECKKITILYLGPKITKS